VASAQCYRGVVKIVLDAMETDPKMAVVVSAMGGKPKVTDLLIDTVNQAADGGIAEYEVSEGSPHYYYHYYYYYYYY